MSNTTSSRYETEWDFFSFSLLLFPLDLVIHLDLVFDNICHIQENIIYQCSTLELFLQLLIPTSRTLIYPNSIGEERSHITGYESLKPGAVHRKQPPQQTLIMLFSPPHTVNQKDSACYL